VEAVLWTGALNALLGATVALAQEDFKRLWAYSTVSQFGVMALALAAGAPFAAQFHLLGTVLPRALLSLCPHLTPAAYGGFPSPLPNLREGRGRRGGVRALTLLPGTLTLLGLPLLSVFQSREAILVRRHLALVALELALALTFAYLLRASWLRRDEPAEMRPQQLISLLILSAGVLASLLGVGPLVRWLSASLGADDVLFPEVWALVSYFFTSPAVLLPLLALSFFFLARRRVAFEALGVPPFVRRGFGLEAFYSRCGGSLLAIAELLWRYFEARMLDRVNYLVAGGALAIAELLWRYFEARMLDRVNYLVAGGARKFGLTLRRAHTGYLAYNLWWVVGSFLVLLLLLAAFLGR
jgi:NADH:ubiquinone oxidoreductase subunit 5 (subunit L)/multisubunit Na+/H+ antiporter MnhA subunit